MREKTLCGCHTCRRETVLIYHGGSVGDLERGLREEGWEADRVARRITCPKCLRLARRDERILRREARDNPRRVRRNFKKTLA